MGDKGRPASLVGTNTVYGINRMATPGGLPLSGGLDSSPGFATVYPCDLGPPVLHESKKLTGDDGL